MKEQPAKKPSVLRSAKFQALLGSATALATTLIVAIGTGGSGPKLPKGLGE